MNESNESSPYVLNEPRTAKKRSSGCFCLSCQGVLLFLIGLAVVILYFRNPKPHEHNSAIITAMTTQLSEDFFDAVYGELSGLTRNPYLDLYGNFAGGITGREIGNRIAAAWIAINGPDLADYHNYLLFSTMTIDGERVSFGINGRVSVNPPERWAEAMYMRLLNLLNEYAGMLQIEQLLQIMVPILEP